MTESADRNRGGSSLNVYVAACTVNLGAFAAGCSLTWSSPSLGKLTAGRANGLQITVDQSSWVGSLTPLGAAFGPLLAGALLDRCGRKNTVLLSMVLSAVSWVLIAAVPVLHALYLARALAGVAVGMVYTAVPVYVAEIAETRLRSSMGTLMQFFLVAGFLLEYAVGPYTSYTALVLVSLAWPVLCFVGLLAWIPDSPQSLLARPPDGERKAMEALRWLRGRPPESALIAELDEIRASADESRGRRSDDGGVLRRLFANRGNAKALAVSCAMVGCQQLSGINVVLMYGEKIFQATGVKVDASISTIIVGTVMLFASGVTPSLAKITSMRMLLYVSGIGMAVTNGTLGAFFFLSRSNNAGSIEWLPVTSLVIFIATYCVGFGPLPWAIMGEIFPSNLKSVASGLTAGFCWTLGFILTLTFQSACDVIGIEYVFWMYAVFCILAVLFVVFLLPETEGKTLQEIQDMLQGRNKSESPKTTNE